MSDTPTMGHNSSTISSGVSIAGDRLLSVVTRIENLKEEQRNLSADIKDIMTEAKSAGFDPKIIREIIKMRAEDKDERELREMTRDAYLRALDMY
jgi:uncharacterized protein (UPF0335 family)